MNRLHLAPSEIAFLVPIFQTIYQRVLPEIVITSENLNL